MVILGMQGLRQPLSVRFGLELKQGVPTLRRLCAMEACAKMLWHTSVVIWRLLSLWGR